jgi:hypothetical protein
MTVTKNTFKSATVAVESTDKMNEAVMRIDVFVLSRENGRDAGQEKDLLHLICRPR